MPTVYITAPPEAADDLAKTLVEERLVACVNQFDIKSTYRWEGEIHEDAEVALLAKTTAGRYDDVEARVLDLHPYDVPCIERFDEDALLPAFAQWCKEATNAD